MNTALPIIHNTGFNIGIRRISRAFLEAHRENGSMQKFKVLGVAVIDEDVPAQLARETIHRINVYGMLIASPSINVALHNRITVIGISTDHQPQAQSETR